MSKEYATTRYSKQAYDVFKDVAQRNNITMIELLDNLASFLERSTPQTHLRILRVPPGKAYKRVS